MNNPIELNGDIAETINSASTWANAVAVAYVDADGRPHLSLRGTIRVFSATSVAFWARSPRLPDALSTHPEVALLYHDLPTKTFDQLTGKAYRVDDAAMRDEVFDSSPAHEQAQDPDRRGSAVIIEIDSVRGRGPDGAVSLGARQ